MNAEHEMATADGLGGEPGARRDGFCPECGSPNICAQTASDEVRPWGCLDCGEQFEDPERPMFAMVVVVEAESPEQAWKGVADVLEGDESTRYVGAPWEAIPAGTTEFNTEAIELGMTIPAEVPELRGQGHYAHVIRKLKPTG